MNAGNQYRPCGRGLLSRRRIASGQNYGRQWSQDTVKLEENVLARHLAPLTTMLSDN
jgi:hypothetical protein